MSNLNMPDARWRPGGARYVAYVVAVILIVLTVVIGVALPETITFTVFELITLALMLIAVLALLHGVGRSFVVVDERGVRVRNGYRNHAIAWTDIEGFAMNDGEPWPTLVTTDDVRVMLFAIQATDGPNARNALVDLRERLDAHR